VFELAGRRVWVAGHRGMVGSVEGGGIAPMPSVRLSSLQSHPVRSGVRETSRLRSRRGATVDSSASQLW
jgi:hypothetical protein